MTDRVERLLAEARLIADYGRQTGCLPDHRLFDALAAVERLEVRAPAAPEVVALEKILHDSCDAVPHHTRQRLLALKDANAVKQEEGRFAGRLVAFSVLLMMVLSLLFAAHRDGVAAVRELENLAAIDARNTYARLLWRVTETRSQVLGMSLEDEEEVTLAAGTYLDSEEELRALSKRIASSQQETERFVNIVGRFPVPGLREGYCLLQLAARSAGLSTFRGASRAAQFCSDLGLTDRTFPLAPRSQTECEDAIPPPAVVQVSRQTSASEDALRQRRLAMEFTASRLDCVNGSPLMPRDVRDFGDQIRLIDGPQKVLATILPALFGAFGAIVFHLRRMMNAKLPNPSRRQLLHRVFMGVLAGTMLAWVAPTSSPVGAVVSEVGLSTFFVAFLLGFSLNIFFKALERFVGVAEGAIDRIAPGTGSAQATQGTD